MKSSIARTHMNKKDSQEKKITDFSKIELLLGLSDGDEFQVKGHIKHLFHYEENAIYDEKGEHISGEMLFFIINHPDYVVNHGKGINSYQVLNEMMAKNVTYSLLLFLFGLFSFFQSVSLLTPSFSGVGILFFVFFLISTFGIGINLGITVVKILLNKESYF